MRFAWAIITMDYKVLLNILLRNNKIYCKYMVKDRDKNINGGEYEVHI